MISLSILLNKLPCSGQFNYLSDHILVKRAIDSMDDCFDFIEEPLYGFRVNVTQEIQCSELGQGLLYRWTEHSILPITTGGGILTLIMLHKLTQSL